MGPLLPILGVVAAAGAIAYAWRSRKEMSSSEHEGMRQGEQDGPKLTRGTDYELEVDLRKQAAGATGTDVSRNLKALFEKAGFSLHDAPGPAGQEQADAFAQGQPSRWLFHARWTRADGYVAEDAWSPAVAKVTLRALS